MFSVIPEDRGIIPPKKREVKQFCPEKLQFFARKNCSFHIDKPDEILYTTLCINRLR